VEGGGGVGTEEGEDSDDDLRWKLGDALPRCLHSLAPLPLDNNDNNYNIL